MSGGARVVCGLVSVEALNLCLSFDTMKSAASQTVTITVIVFASPFADFEANVWFVGAQHAPHCPGHARQRLLLPCSNYSSITELDQIYDGFVLAEAYYLQYDE